MKELVKAVKGLQKEYTKKQERARAFSLKLEFGGKLKVVNAVLECKTVEEIQAKLEEFKQEAQKGINEPVKQALDCDVKCRFFGMKEEVENIIGLLVGVK